MTDDAIRRQEGGLAFPILLLALHVKNYEFPMSHALTVDSTNKALVELKSFSCTTRGRSLINRLE